MNGLHDCGGMEGLGPIEPSDREPIFATEWEARVFGLMWAAGANGFWNIDEMRFAMERMPALEYLQSSYYEHWFFGITTLLREKGVITEAELEFWRGRSSPEASAAAPLRPGDVPTIVEQGFPLKLNVDHPPRFAPGDIVRTINAHPHGHTRLPRYARDKAGQIVRDHGVYPFPDSNVAGDPSPQHVYVVRFSADQLWGNCASAKDSVCLDLWDDHLIRSAAE